MRSSAFGTIVVVFSTIASAGCSLVTSSDCVSIGVSGIHVTVLDRQTRQTPAGAVVTVTDGEYRETLVRSGGVFAGAPERTGSYTVIVEAPGYVRWTRENVNVIRRGSCNYLQRVTLTSDLERTS